MIIIIISSSSNSNRWHVAFSRDSADSFFFFLRGFLSQSSSPVIPGTSGTSGHIMFYSCVVLA